MELTKVEITSNEQKQPVLRISEQFYSIQGEGRTMGIPAVFVRLQACNILCKGEWICDTIEVWKKGEKTSIDEWLLSMQKYVKHLKAGAHLIFTGGEPLIQQKAIEWAIRCFNRVYGFKPFIEVETNGTIAPIESLQKLVGLFNCSFKLANSGVEERRRINKESLNIISNNRHIFKIVITKKEDYDEAMEILNSINADKKNIYLMPGGDNIETINKNSKMVAEICIKESVNFSTRLQIVLWNKTVGV